MDLDIEALIEAPFRKNDSIKYDYNNSDKIKREDYGKGSSSYEKSFPSSRGDHRSRRSKSPIHRYHSYDDRTPPIRAQNGGNYTSSSSYYLRTPERHEKRELSRSSKRREEDYKNYRSSNDYNRDADDKRSCRKSRWESSSRMASIPPPPPPRPRSPNLSDAQRDRRTIFARQLAQRVQVENLKRFFVENVGPVRAARIVRDKHTGRSKGIGYIEFYDEDSVPKALNMTGHKLEGIPIIIELTETEKNRIAQEALEASRQLKISASRHVPMIAAPPSTLLIQGLNPRLGEIELGKIFEPFGDIEFIQVIRDPNTDQSKEMAHIRFKRAVDARSAMDQMDGFVLLNKPIKVTILLDDKIHSEGGVVTNKSLSNYAFNKGTQSGDVAEEVLITNSKARVELMNKLQNRNVINDPDMVYVKLSNLYNPEEEIEPDWEYLVADDVREECSKFGAILHMSLQRNNEGEVYVMFQKAKDAKEASESFKGRWFANRQINADFVSKDFYHQMFPNAPALNKSHN